MTYEPGHSFCYKISGVAKTELFLRTPKKIVTTSPLHRFQMGATLKGKNLLPQREQILSFKSSTYFGKLVL